MCQLPAMRPASALRLAKEEWKTLVEAMERPTSPFGPPRPRPARLRTRVDVRFPAGARKLASLFQVDQVVKNGVAFRILIDASRRAKTHESGLPPLGKVAFGPIHGFAFEISGLLRQSRLYLPGGRH